MQKILSTLVLLGLSTTVVVAATGSGMTLTPTPTVSTGTVVAAPTVSTTVSAPVINPVATSSSLSTSFGENKSVSCTSNPAFGTNSCDACFDGGSVTVGKRLTGLFDNWTNPTTGFLVAYQAEQKNPNMVAFGATTWTSSPTDTSKVWKNGSDIVWVTQSGSTKMQYILGAGQKVKFVETELAAGYTLEKTDRKNGDLVGMMRYPTVFHTIDTTTGSEGTAKTHVECVSYKLSAPEITTTPVTPTPITPEITKTQTGPTETIILILAAFFIAFGLMFSLRKRI
jgi:hypothetical protein